jgi:hypothetical protein
VQPEAEQEGGRLLEQVADGAVHDEDEARLHLGARAVLDRREGDRRTRNLRFKYEAVGGDS